MTEGVAVVGLDLVTALGAGPAKVWGEMLRYRCGLRPLTRFPRGRYQSDVAGELPPELLACFQGDSGRAGFSLAHALALHTAREALKQAGANGPAGTARRVGLVLATTKGDLTEFEGLVADPEQPGTGRFNPYVLARDLARDLGLQGPVLAVSGACASGLMAIIQAARFLVRGGADLAVAVGVDVLSDFVLAGFSSVAGLDPGPCRPYDAGRRGLSLGEGAGALVLAPTGAVPGRELARVRGWGVANDARHITAPAESAHGLIQAVRKALARAGLPEGEIHYVNGHGTGTIYNDAMEAKAIFAVFGEPTPPVSSFKGYFGHTLGAAGIIEAALTVTALREKTVPASLGLGDPGVAEPIRLAARHLSLKTLDHALTLKSGFGGINAAVVLSAAPAP